MVDKHQQALKTFETICAMLDAREWKYDRDDENMRIICRVTGEDLPVDVVFLVQEKQQVVTLLSPLPFKMAEEKRVDGALAVAVANYGLINGTFDYDLRDGEIRFRMVSSFLESDLNAELFAYMLICSVSTVDDYNDKFMMLNKGLMTLEQFIEAEQQG